MSTDSPHHGWQHVAKLFGLLGFLAFAMWLFASKFDSSELKTLITMAGPLAAREFWPVLRSILKPSTELLARGQVE